MILHKRARTIQKAQPVLWCTTEQCRSIDELLVHKRSSVIPLYFFVCSAVYRKNKNSKNKAVHGQGSLVLSIPASLHVLRLVHANSQFDLQVLVWAGLGHSHLMQLRLLWTVRGRVKDNLINNQKEYYYLF